MVISLAAQPWWTPADQAELDLLTHELVKVSFVHRDRCSTCRGQGWCPALPEATTALLEWREGRILRSKAAYLRELQTLLDPQAERRAVA